MPHRLTVPPPDGPEELRLWAEAIADLHHAGSLMAERAPEFVPGEHVDGFRASWQTASASLERLVRALVPGPGGAREVDPSALGKVALNGPAGAQKRAALTQERDSFQGHALVEPRTEERTRRAGQAGERYADLGATALDSLGTAVSEVPGLSTACKVGEEGLLGLKHLLGVRGRRKP